MNKIIKVGTVVFGLVVAAAVWDFQTANVAAAKTPIVTRFVESAPAASLCSANEQTVWSCPTTRNKIASVCASKGLTENSGYVQYRFGLPGSVELQVPQNTVHTQKAFAYSRYTRPLVTMLSLKFVNQGVTYQIHDDDNEEEKPAVRESSVDITNSDGKQIGTVKCRLSRGSLMKLEDIVPRDESDN